MKKSMFSYPLVLKMTGSVLCVVFAVLIVTGQIQQFSGSFIKKEFNEHNVRYLKETEERALAGFMTLSGAKMGLSMIEGSTGNVGVASIEFGDAVQSVLDAIDLAWKTLFASLTILFSLRLLLEVVDYISWYILLVGMVLILTYIIHDSFKNNRFYKKFFRWKLPVGLHKMAAFACLLFFFLNLGVPLSVYGSSLLSDRFSRPLSQHSMGEIERFSNEVQTVISFEGEEAEKDDESKTWSLNPVDGIRHFAGYVEKQFSGISEKVHTITSFTVEGLKVLTYNLVTLITSFLFDVLIFPLLLVLLILWFFKWLFAFLLNIKNDRSVLEDMDRLNEWYLQKTGMDKE